MSQIQEARGLGMAGVPGEPDPFEAMNYMAYDQENSRGNLQDGDHLTDYHFRNAGPLELAGLRDGVQMGDITGTFSGGIQARVRGNRVYFRAVNRMNMASFAQANPIPLQNRLIDLPDAGPLSEVEMIFEWSRPIPRHLRPRQRR